MTDYKKIPDWWAVCPNENCTVADTCLRHLVYNQLTQKCKHWLCLLPQAWAEPPCHYYQKAEKVTMARGIAAVYRNVPYDRRVYSNLRIALTSYFGSKGTYYRYKNRQRDINPKMQQEIRDIVHRFAPGVEVAFDETYEDYDFTQY